jgi:hypothetical protein
MALRLAAASLAARNAKGLPMPNLGAKESKRTKSIASPRQLCAQQSARHVVSSALASRPRAIG